MRGFLGFIFDLLFAPVCLCCGLSLAARDPSPPVVIPEGWPPGTDCFFRTDFRMVIMGVLSIPARILCGDCWLSLEPAFRGAFIPKSVGGRCRPSGGETSRPVGPAGRVEPVSIISPFFTNGTLLEIVRFLKYSGGRQAVPELSWWMAESYNAYACNAAPSIRRGSVAIPVPLHRSRQRSRGYNQARLLAACVASRLGFETYPAVLERTRSTMCQAKLSPEERAENVRGAFHLADPDSIKDKDVILVDDLVTTGETVGACISALRRGYPSSITVLSAGRVKGVDAWQG